MSHLTNIQVTHDADLNKARSESSIVINPNNPLQIVAGSKRFRNIETYDFTLATSYSTDGGSTWHDSSELVLADSKLGLKWSLLSDPALAWDDSGNVFLVGLAGNNPPTFDTVGLAVYGSTDGGKTWNPPHLIDQSSGDDKQWAAGDGNPTSKYRGRVYAVWDDGPGAYGNDMRFARTLNHGASWVGAGADPGPTVIVSLDSSSPEINVSPDGTIYVVWMSGNPPSQIKMIVSTDGGESFQQSLQPPATGVVALDYSLVNVHGFGVFPGGNFRVRTFPTACAGSGKKVAVAWADYRDNVSRIYYSLTDDGGSSWPVKERPLLSMPIPTTEQHFHPQLISSPKGSFGCAFYDFAPNLRTLPKAYFIDVKFAISNDEGLTFPHYFTVTDRPWDPTIDAPWSHGYPDLTFIGDYFGLDANLFGFHPLWTDTRTGIQELFTDDVPHRIIIHPHGVPEQNVNAIVAQIINGIINDAGGIEIVGGRVIRIPPWDPWIDILLGVAIDRIAVNVSGLEGVEIQKAAMNLVAKSAQMELQRLGGKLEGEQAVKASKRETSSKKGVAPQVPKEEHSE